MTDPGSPNQTKKNLALAAAGPGIASTGGHRHSAAPQAALGPADYLLRALGAESMEERRDFAELGLARFEATDDDDEELKALLLRQLYLVALENDDHEEAYEIALCMIDLEALGDIARQDAARAALALEKFDDALGHLRIAARVCPANRRSFHLSHLGALLRFAGQLDQSLEAFEKASRWATEDRALVTAQKSLVMWQSGSTTDDLNERRRDLETTSDRPAYALWILGELCFRLKDYSAAAAYLQRFLDRQEKAPKAKALSLRGEIRHARSLLAQIAE